MAIERNGFRILRYVVDGALVTLILVVLFGVILGRLVPLTGHETLVIGGASMEPAIHLGSAVVEDVVEPADLHVGDVVSLHSGSRLQTIFTHRVTRLVERDDGLWIETKGDANDAIDPSITPFGQVIGRVSVNVPYAGFLIQWLSIPSGVLAIICIAASLFVLALILESLEQGSAPRRLPAPAPGRTAPAPKTVARVIASSRATRERRADWSPGPGPNRAPPMSRPAASGDRGLE